jgi:hypothetical protein
VEEARAAEGVFIVAARGGSEEEPRRRRSVRFLIPHAVF